MIIWWYCSVMCKCSTYKRRGNSLCALWNCNAIQPDANGTSKSKAFTFCYFSCLFSTKSNFIFRWRCFVRHVLFATFPNVTERTHLCKRLDIFHMKKGLPYKYVIRCLVVTVNFCDLHQWKLQIVVGLIDREMRLVGRKGNKEWVVNNGTVIYSL